VEVQCLPKDLPEYVQVDMGALDIGQHVHLSDLKLPAGVQLVALVHGHDLSVASVQAPKGGGDEEAPAAAGGEAKE
jgi:large subunit ribosomal protein L25